MTGMDGNRGGGSCIYGGVDEEKENEKSRGINWLGICEMANSRCGQGAQASGRNEGRENRGSREHDRISPSHLFLRRPHPSIPARPSVPCASLRPNRHLPYDNYLRSPVSKSR